ncbi:PQQ-binding-like beta-propeller repeat protein [Microbulbifer aggregans]|uniref:outer membrane protein assembly factor BamB family protein n=1 Tax=Microbulbifer aggregans TaxID=1769779 RepID=UPI001CFECAE7|nr:PQQ-binding-like beta-propeller repeat protein [Microbulbifer aggregans]
MGLVAGRICLALGFVLAATWSFAEEIRDYYAEPGLNPFKEAINQNFHEHIDPFSGTLQLKYTDIQIPGNGGMDINVNRVYTSLQTNEYPIRTAYGVGWVMNFGRIVAPNGDQDKICAQGVWQINTSDNPSLELPDGGRELLALNSILSDGSLITRSNWRAECVTGQPGMVVSAPNGTKYTMDHFDFFEGEPSWHTTRIEDVNGNWITISYEEAENGASYIKEIYRSEEGENTPVVVFGYEVTEDGLWLLSTITANGQEWKYEFEEIPGYMFPAYHLKKVIRPDNKYWEYSYNGIASDPDPNDEVQEDGVGSHSLQLVKYPDGAEIEYTYQFVQFDKGSGLRTTAIDSKYLSGQNIVSGEWTYQFEPHSVPIDGESLRYDKTIVTGPDAVTEYYHFGKDFRQVSFEEYEFIRPYAVGLLVKEFKYSKQGKLLFSRLQNWADRKISNENMWHGSGYRTWWIDFGTYAPVLVEESYGYDSEATTEPGEIKVSRNVSYFEHDAYGNPERIQEFNNFAENDDIKTTFYEYEYDTAKWILGNVTREESLMDGDTSLITKIYNDLGQLEKQTVNGVATDYLYTENGDVESIIDANGNKISYSNYKRGIAQEENHPEDTSISRVVNSTGTLESVTDARGKTTSFSYDDMNRLTGINFPINASVSISYSNNKRTLTRGGFQQIDEFDSLGRKLKTVRNDTSTGESITQRFELDSLGRVTYESYPYSDSEVGGVNYKFDALGRVTEQKFPGGVFVSNIYDDETTEVVDERGNTTTYHYRNIGLGSSAIYAIEQPESITTVFKRNLLDQPYEIHQYGVNGGMKREYEYNRKYFLESKIEPEIGTTSYTYDLVGNLKSSSIDGQKASQFVYDNLYRLDFVDYPEGTFDVDLSYDENGNVTDVVTGDSAWSYIYDDNGNLTDEVLTISSNISRNYSFHYDYNDLDFLSGINYPNSLYLDYAPNNLGRPTKAGSFANSVTYHPSGQVESLVYGNGKLAEFAVNERLFPESISIDGLVNLTYSYDSAGNVTSIVDAINSSNTVTMNQAESYDSVNRLRQVSGPWGLSNYSYTTFGDISSKTIDGVNSNYVYDNGLLKKLKNSETLKLMEFDSFGNLTKKAKYGLDPSGYVSSNSEKLFRYDHASRLIGAEAEGSHKQYFYDGNGHRYLENLKGSYQNNFSVYTNAGALLFEEEYDKCSTTNYIRMGNLLVAQSVDEAILPSLDTDADNISDCLETQLGLDPNDPQDAALDTDGDGLTNAEEVSLGTIISLIDSDGDGVSDGDEHGTHGTDPLVADSDNDGLNDGEEISEGLNILISDTDHDGINDGDEIEFGLDALNPADGVLDLDGDGFSNRQESATKSDLSSGVGKPISGDLAWYTDTSGTIDKALSIDSTGNLYVGARNGYLYSYYPDGSLKWKFQTGDEVLSTPAIGVDGTIYVGSDDNKLYAVNPDGTEKWHFQTYGDIQTSPSIAADGTIYVASYDRKLYALNEDGSLRWSYTASNGDGFLSSPAIGSDGTVYVGTREYYQSYLIAFSPDGSVKWRYQTENSVNSSPALGQNGDVYFYDDDGFIYSLTKAGELKWKYYTGFETTTSWWWSPVVGSNDTIYTGTAKGELIALDKAGQLLWIFDPLGTPFTPVIASDNSVYFGTGNGHLYALNGDGSLKWRYEDGYILLSPPSIDVDGTLYIGDRNGRILSFVEDNGGLAASTWPKFAKDRYGSGNVCRDGNIHHDPVADSDADGIPDCAEFIFGLDNNDGADAAQDSDGDTLSNLDEYLSGTSPVHIDTDGDGIADNDEETFSSKTTLPDSDGDGILDGDEDYDFDGVSNAAEVAEGSDPYKSEIVLLPGVNLIHYPFTIPDGLSAFGLLDQLGGDGVVLKIERYEPSSSTIISAEYVDGIPQGEDFSIQSGHGYVVHMENPSSYIADGDIICPDSSLEPGINLIGFSCISGGFSAFDLLVHLGGEGVVSSVQRYNQSKGRYESATWESGQPIGVDFPLSNNKAVIVHAIQDVAVVESPTDYTGHLVTSHSNGEVAEGDPVRIEGDLKALVTISGSVEQDAVSVIVNGVEAIVVNGNFAADIPLSSGMQSVEVIVTNRDNLTTRSEITLDVQSPLTINVTSHFDGQTTSQSNPIIFGSRHPTVDKVLVNGDPATLESGSFRFGFYCYSKYGVQDPHCDSKDYKERLDLGVGQHTLTIEAFSGEDLLDTQVIHLNVERLVISGVNPGVVSQSLENITFPSSKIIEVSSYQISYTDISTYQLESRTIATNTMPAISGNNLQTSVDFEVVNAMSGRYDRTVDLRFYDINGLELYTVDVLVTYEVPVSNAPPEFTIDSPFEGEDIYYSTGLVSGHYSHSVSEIKINGESPKFFENGIFSHSVDLTSGNIRVEAVGENPDLTTLKGVNFNTHVYEVTLAPGEIFSNETVETINFPSEKSVGYITAYDIKYRNAPNFVQQHNQSMSLGTESTTPYKTLRHRFGIQLSESQYNQPTSGVYDFYIDWAPGIMGGFSPYMHIPIRLTVLESRDPPHIELYSHLDGETMPSSTVGIAVRVSNDSAAEVTINGVQAVAEEIRNIPYTDHTYSAIVELSEGSNSIIVEAVGLNGLSSSETFTLNVSSQPVPEVNVTSHSEGEVIASDPVDVIVQSQEAIPGLTMYLNGIKQSSPDVNGTTYSWSNPLLQEGNNLIELYVPGYMEPVSTRTIVLMPPPAPIVIVSSHSEGEVVTDSPIVLIGSVANPVESLSINGFDVELDGGNYTFEHLDLFDGSNAIEIVAKGPGSHGKVTNHTLNLVYQSSEPPREVSVAQSGKAYFRHEFTVSSSLYSSVWSVNYSYGSGAPAGLSADWVGIEKLSNNRIVATLEMDLAYSADAGSYSFPINMEFMDADSNAKFNEVVNVNLVVTNENFTIPGSSILRGETFTLDSPTFDSVSSVQLTPTSSLPTGIYISHYSSSKDIASLNWKVDLEIQVDTNANLGSYTVPVTFDFLDADSGVIHSITRDIYIEVVLSDPGPPTVEIESHNNGEAVTTPMVTISGTVADASAMVTVNGQPATVVASSGNEGIFSADISLSEGGNLISVVATAAGQLTSTDEITLNLSSQSSGGDLVVPPGETVRTSEAFVMSQSNFYSVAGLGLNYSGSAQAINNLTLSNLSLTPVVSELTWILEFDVSVNSSASAGVYDLSITYTFKDSSQAVLVEETRDLSVEVTE